MKLLCSFVCLLASFLPAALAAGEGKIQVLATFAPVYSLTKNVAGEAASVGQLLPAGGEPHDFALSPGDLRKMAQADVIVENGLGVESWLSGAFKKSRALRLVASAGIATDDGNPHVWLDPVLAIRQVENIRDGLAKRDPANAEIYARNAAAFIEKLKALDAEIRAALAPLPDKRMFTSHDAFHYFAKRYGFEVVGVLEEFPGREPTPKAMKNLRDTIVKNKVEVLFTEPHHPSRVLASLSKELKLPIVEIDPMEMGKPSAELYEKVMRSNLKTLREALGGAR